MKKKEKHAGASLSKGREEGGKHLENDENNGKHIVKKGPGMIRLCSRYIEMIRGRDISGSPCHLAAGRHCNQTTSGALPLIANRQKLETEPSGKERESFILK